MKMTLTDRDKILLEVMAVVLVVAGIYLFLFKPLLTNQENLADQILTEEDNQAQMESKILMLGSYQQGYEDIKSQLLEKQDQMYDYMDNSEIDKLLTQEVLSYGLSSRNLTIDITPNNEPISYYIASTEGLLAQDSGSDTSASDHAATDTASADAASTDNTSTDSTSTDSTTADTGATDGTSTMDGASDGTTIVCTSNVSMDIVGDRTLFNQILDDFFNNKPSLRVVSFSISQDTNYMLDGVYTDNSVLTMNLQIYMVQKSAIEDMNAVGDAISQGSATTDMEDTSLEE